MKVIEIMERAGMQETGKALAYIKDALEEMNILSEIHIRIARINIESGKRFYDLPDDLIKLIDIRCKGHDTDDNSYRTIPRSVHEPETEDTDGV